MRTILILSFASAAWAQDEKPVLKPDALPTENARAIEALKTVCTANLEKQSVDQRLLALCQQKCPAATSFKGDDSEWVLGVTFGHFLSAGADNAVVAVTGCEPHALNFGGSYLLERRDGRWKALWYEGGLITDECHKTAARDGRDVLVCHLDDGHMGERESTLYAVDLKTGKQSHNLFQSADTLEVCGGEAVHSSMDRVDFTATGMTIHARYGKITTTGKQIADCKAGHLPAVATKPYTIGFTFDGDTYRVDAGSRDAARVFEVR